MPNPAEVAQLIVAGHKLEDWESVWVQHRWSEGWDLFRFTTAERDNLPTDWRQLQFKPGDECQIMLGGQLALTGPILQRQVTYDATTHQVQLSGVSESWAAATSSVPMEKSNHDNKDIKQVADKVLEDHKTKAEAVGKLDLTKFFPLSSQPGERIFDFLDRLCRVRGITLGTDISGNLLLIGEHSKPIVQDLREGENILKMQCIISNEALSTIYSTTAQQPVNYERAKRKQSEMQAKAKGLMKEIYRYSEIPAEQPVKTDEELQQRANYQRIAADGTLITAFATVQGWLRDGKVLWAVGDNVNVYSPMAMLNMVMKIQSATFAQDNRGGTTTTLELVLPWRLGDKPFKTGGGNLNNDVPAPKDPATTTST